MLSLCSAAGKFIKRTGTGRRERGGRHKIVDEDRNGKLKEVVTVGEGGGLVMISAAADVNACKKIPESENSLLVPMNSKSHETLSMRVNCGVCYFLQVFK